MSLYPCKDHKRSVLYNQHLPLHLQHEKKNNKGLKKFLSNHE
jgi:hypothetical protein